MAIGNYWKVFTALLGIFACASHAFGNVESPSSAENNLELTSTPNPENETENGNSTGVSLNF
jgi:hypothetical protein